MYKVVSKTLIAFIIAGSSISGCYGFKTSEAKDTFVSGTKVSEVQKVEHVSRLEVQSIKGKESQKVNLPSNDSHNLKSLGVTPSEFNQKFYALLK